MWHSVGLTLLVFVATLLIVLLLMVCASRAERRGGPFTHGRPSGILGEGEDRLQGFLTLSETLSCFAGSVCS
ncbi:hypothetical protein H8959_009983 [Pygathrix nigripes]